MALYTAIDSVVRAVGRIVVCVDAAAELSTISSSSLVRKLPKPEVPKMERAEHREHVARVVGVLQADALRPDAGVGLGGHDHEGVRGQQDDASRSPRPGPGSCRESLVSSLTETAVSQPQ